MTSKGYTSRKQNITEKVLYFGWTRSRSLYNDEEFEINHVSKGEGVEPLGPICEGQDGPLDAPGLE